MHIFKAPGPIVRVAYDRSGLIPDALPSEIELVALAHTECGRDVQYSKTVSLRGCDLSAVSDCCRRAIANQ